MKTLLAFLLSFIICEAPVLAIHGGYTLGGNESVTGTYAGVLLPINTQSLQTSGSGTGAIGNYGTDSLGLFTLSVPNAGVGSGSIVIFSGANSASGNINALPDPNNNGSIIGVFVAQDYDSLIQDSDNVGVTFNVQQLIAQVNGSIEASIENVPISNSPTGIDLSGTANGTFSTTGTNPDEVFFFGSNLVPVVQVTFAVDGFQQSSVATETSGTF